MKLHLELALPTSLNKLYINQATYNPKTKKYVATGKRIMSEEGKHKKRLIQKYAKKQLSESKDWDYELTKTNYIYMDVNIYFNRKGSDADNIFKLLNDSLQGIVFDNDSRVLPRVQKVLYDSENPRVEVELSLVEYIGIFDNKEELEDFEEVCKLCKRYLNGRCSLLKEAIGGRIQEEIVDFECQSFVKKK